MDRTCGKLGLSDIFGRRYEHLSGSRKRRCEIAAALVNTPEVLFLDEPATGLDPAARQQVWSSLEEMRAVSWTRASGDAKRMNEKLREFQQKKG